jgi:hypothetical protein
MRPKKQRKTLAVLSLFSAVSEDAKQRHAAKPQGKPRYHSAGGYLHSQRIAKIATFVNS